MLLLFLLSLIPFIQSCLDVVINHDTACDCSSPSSLLFTKNDTHFAFTEAADCNYKIIVPNANKAFLIILDISAVKQDLLALCPIATNPASVDGELVDVSDAFGMVCEGGMWKATKVPLDPTNFLNKEAKEVYPNVTKNDLNGKGLKFPIEGLLSSSIIGMF